MFFYNFTSKIILIAELCVCYIAVKIKKTIAMILSRSTCSFRGILYKQMRTLTWSFWIRWDQHKTLIDKDEFHDD